MPKTLEEEARDRAIKLANKKAADVAEEAERLAQLAAYRAALPKKLKELQGLANRLGIDTFVTLTEVGPTVHFWAESSYDCYLSYESEEWEVSALENSLVALDNAQKQKVIDIEAAKVSFNKLTPEEKTLVKKYISYLS